MFRDLVSAISDPDLYISVAIVLMLLTAAMFWFMWFQQRKLAVNLKDFVRYGLWSSNHQTVHAGSTGQYFDADLFLGQPKNIGTTLIWFKEELQRQIKLSGKIDRLAFIEKEEGPVGALTLKDLLSWETKVPAAIVRPGRKGPALRIKVVHESDALEPRKDYKQISQSLKTNGEGERVVLVSDVTTTGTTILDAVKLIEDAGGQVEAAFVLYDRGDKVPVEDRIVTAESRLRDLNIRLVAMFKSDQLGNNTATVATAKAG
jgi:hypothetical protein